MKHLFKHLMVVLLIAIGMPDGPAAAQTTAPPVSSRIALVIGNGAYGAAPLPTAPNDAGLVAQTLAAAGFDVTGARDLDGEALRRAFREFLDKAAAAGPQGTAFVYLAGHALQFEGDNYFVPVDAALSHDADVPIETVRLADFTRALAAIRLATTIVVVDGAYADQRQRSGFAAGLALVDPDPGTLLAFNAAPGTTAPISAGSYGTYATILTQNMKQGGVPVEEIFDRVRVGVNTATRGAVVPWDASKLSHSFTFFDRAPNAPALGSAQIPFASLRNRPLRDFTPEQAYDVALARDTFPAYQEYLTVFPDSPLARRVRVLLAARREALFWRDALNGNSPAAFWTYLRRYPKGPHAAEAQRRLSRLAAAMAPPSDFAPLAFDIPPPPEDEYPIIERRFILADPDLEPPPPPPVFLLPPPPPEVVVLPPPSPAPPRGFLPIPVPIPIPYVRPLVAPGAIMPPRGLKGAYPRPRPFVTGPANGGILPQPGSEPPPGPDHLKAVGAPPPNAPVPLPPSAAPAPVAPPGLPVPAGQRRGKPHGPAPLPVPGNPPSQAAPVQPPALLPAQPQPSAGAPLPVGPATGEHKGQKHKGPQPGAPAGGTLPPAAAVPNVAPPVAPLPNAQAPGQRPKPSGRIAPLPGGAAPVSPPPVAMPPSPTVPQGAAQPGRRRPLDGERNPDNGQQQLQRQLQGGGGGGPRLQPPGPVGGPAMIRPESQPRPREPMQRQQPPAGPGGPPQGAGQQGQPPGAGAGRENRNRRPECGHPGQPPCQP